MPLGFSIKEFGRGFRREFAASIRPVAVASTLALRDAAKDVQIGGRANIKSSGFSARFVRGFTATAYPKRKFSVDAVAYTRHKIGFATIFEEGANIRGKPLLWIPLPSTPQKIGGKRTTPRIFARQVAPLQYVDNGKHPLLYAKVPGGRRRGNTFGAARSVSLAKFRRGGTQSTPVFIGLSAVDIERRWNISEAVDSAVVSLPAKYYSYLNPENP